MLHTIDLACGYGTRPVLTGVSLGLPPATLLGVLGANGTGKSTLLATLAGEIPPLGGSVSLGGTPLAQLSPLEQARRRAVLPQSPALRFDLGVAEVVAMGAYPFAEPSSSDRETVVRHALALTGSAHLVRRRHGSLSGGEQQRVHLARALTQALTARAAGEYRLLLLDEPTASLDPGHGNGVMRALAKLSHEEGVATLAILHDVNLAARWCDRLLLLAHGRVVALGPPRQVLTPARLGATYGITARVSPHPHNEGGLFVSFD